MSDRPSVGTETPADPLLAAVEVARLAPSVHNTQPWLWRRAGDALELRAERARQLAVADPDGLLLTQSCGAALHHARVALAALGHRVEVRRMPDEADPDLLATLRLAGPATPDGAALVEAARVRRTDRRPVADRPVTQDEVDAVVKAVTEQNIQAYPLRRDEIVELTVAVADADRAEADDQAHREEIAAWIGGEREDNTGVPASVVPDQPPQTRVPGRYFGPPGTLPIDEGHDLAARYLVLHGEADEREDWLRAGEALSAAWLTAAARGLSLLPISAVVEVPATRLALRHLLSGIGHPYLAFRLGHPDAGPVPPATPRLPLAAILREAS